MCFIEERGLDVDAPIKVPWDLFIVSSYLVIPRLLSYLIYESLEVGTW